MGEADLLAGAAAGGLIVLFGAGYALLFALGKLRRSPAAHATSYVSYGLLTVSVYVLSDRLALEGPWLALVVVILVGYLLAPPAIWRLCVGTHEAHGVSRRSEVGEDVAS